MRAAVGVRASNAINDSTLAVNIFTVGGAASGDGAVLPALLVPVMLANSSTTQRAILTLNLAPTASELGWPAVHGIANASALILVDAGAPPASTFSNIKLESTRAEGAAHASCSRRAAAQSSSRCGSPAAGKGTAPARSTSQTWLPTRPWSPRSSPK